MREEDICRFCWQGSMSAENPLLCSCKCDGTMKFLHYLCLKEWIKTKVVHKHNACVNSYLWKTFECEICKSPYPCTLVTG